MQHRYSRLFPAFSLLIDVLLLNITLSLAFNTSIFSVYTSTTFMPVSMLANCVWLLLVPVCGTYISSRSHVLKYSLSKLLSTATVHLAVIIVFSNLFSKFWLGNASLVIFYTSFCFSTFLVRCILTMCLHYIRRKGYNARKILIVGDKTISITLIQHFSNHPEYGYDVLNTDFSASAKDLTEDYLNSLILDPPDQIFFCYEEIDEGAIEFLSRYFDRRPIVAKVVSNVLLASNYMDVINYDSLPALQINNNFALGKGNVILKRVFDVSFSIVVMVLGLPIFIILYIITYLTSAGPVFFKQERIGLRGKPFTIYKFRSMHINSELTGPQLSKDNDPRITPWGLIMRKTRLDELPQFWNVLKGDMSIVGPRPERLHFIEKISERKNRYKRLLHIKPGITSIGQIYYGYAENIDQMCERMEYDLLYLEDVNLNADVKLIANTIKVMFQGRGK